MSAKWMVVEKRHDVSVPYSFGPFDDFMTALSFVAESANMRIEMGTKHIEYEYVTIEQVKQ